MAGHKRGRHGRAGRAGRRRRSARELDCKIESGGRTKTPGPSERRNMARKKGKAGRDRTAIIMILFLGRNCQHVVPQAFRINSFLY